MQFCETCDQLIDPEYETCPVCAREQETTDLRALRDFYAAVRDIAKTADGLGVFEKGVMVALEEAGRKLAPLESTEASQ